jgi:excisionase family DNA binding protein
MSPLMTYQEAADYLRISLATIDRMIRANELSSVLIRGRRLFRIRDLDKVYPLPQHSRLQMRQRIPATPHPGVNERLAGRYGCRDQL